MIGRELNPRIDDFDVKFFVELRPSLMGWLVTNICMGVKQYHDLGRITNSMILVLIFQAWYVIDALWMEVSISPSFIRQCLPTHIFCSAIGSDHYGHDYW